MSDEHTVLLLGGTGRTGRRVLEQLLRRGVSVRAIVRSASRLPEGAAGNPRLTVIVADLLSLGDAELRRYVAGCDAVVSCLGHTISLKGIFGSPRNLVERAIVRVCGAVEALRPAVPIRLILMSSVSVNCPGRFDARRGRLERAVLWVLRGLVPPARDNQRAADFLRNQIGERGPFIQWVAVRPDTLEEGDVCKYAVHQGLVSGLFAPAKTAMANVAHFMCVLVTDATAWRDWMGGMPVIVNEASK
jgi:nucleoside-diphosphate-sugar epimerase